MSAPFGRLPSGGEIRLRQRVPVRAISAFLLACIGLTLVPVLAAVATYAIVHTVEHRCPVPVILRGTIAPERELASLTVYGSDRP